MRSAAPYIFHSQTMSLCETCHDTVPAKVILEGGKAYFVKRCPDHGVQKTLVSTDADYFQLAKSFLKPGDRPQHVAGRTDYGCPWDCGLCPDHEQHSCLAIVEINEICNIACPVCFADSTPHKGGHRTLDEVRRMLDTVVKAEGEADLVQLSGGEPTLHPQFFDILAECKARPIRHVMVNTNGIRIAEELEFARRLAEFTPGLEVYLQFDSLRPAALKAIRGADMTRIRRQALENLEAAGVATTLVCVVSRGHNDDEMGDIVRHALEWPCVRGVTFQPVQLAGRVPETVNNQTAKSQRVVLSEIRRNLGEDGSVFGLDDIIPLPCHPEMIAIAYGLRKGRTVVPVTSLIPREEFLAAAPNAITFEKNEALRDKLVDLFSLGTFTESTEKMAQFLCCLPEFPQPQNLSYADIFRVAIVEFMDAYNFCVGSVKRSCIHFATLDGRMIPFDTYNLFYRNGRIGGIRQRLDRIRDARRERVDA